MFVFHFLNFREWENSLLPFLAHALATLLLLLLLILFHFHRYIRQLVRLHSRRNANAVRIKSTFRLVDGFSQYFCWCARARSPELFSLFGQNAISMSFDEKCFFALRKSISNGGNSIFKLASNWSWHKGSFFYSSKNYVPIEKRHSETNI